jgi:hypothetical protein
MCSETVKVYFYSSIGSLQAAGMWRGRRRVFEV